MRVVVQSDSFDPGAELTKFAAGRTDLGAVVTFSGLVRDVGGGLDALRIEHYPGMTERAIAQIAQQAKDRWDLGDVLVVHRYGALKLGEVIMMVATAAPHRADAFAAAEFLMDYLKSRAPFWKQEITASGAAWVDAKEADEQALTRWDAGSTS